MNHTHHVVIIGGGFGGLYAVQAMKRASVRITLIDKRNFHLFQPLLYQVATGGLSSGDIASPLRSVLSRQKNVEVIAAEVIDIDPVEQQVILADGAIAYDTLIMATGMTNFYFGNDAWQEKTLALKSIEDALEMRRRIFLAFETAEREQDVEQRQSWLTFVVIGAGPTGVELSGALAELAHGTLKDNFRHFDPAQTKILLLEGKDRVLPPYPAKLSAIAERSLQKMGVDVITEALVTDIGDGYVTYKIGDDEWTVGTETVLWAAGLKVTALVQTLANRTDAKQDRAGRIIVEPDLTVPGYPNIFVVGDIAHFAHNPGDDDPLPGIAPVAMQEGKYVANLIAAQQRGKSLPPFAYSDRGTMAVIGRNAAVADLGFLQFGGFFAWQAWVFIHIWYLVEFDSKVLVMTQWAWNYFTRKRGGRLIIGESVMPNLGRRAISPPTAPWLRTEGV